MNIGEPRKERRMQIVEAAMALVGFGVSKDFDAVHAPLSPIDVVMVAGSPWLKEALEKDYLKDESGYRKIGGGANCPKNNYFCRSATNLIYFLKRQGLYIPRGGKTKPELGMACFLDWDDRGRFNFAPDRSGIIVSVGAQGSIEKVVIAINKTSSAEQAFLVELIEVESHSIFDKAVIGYSDLP